MVLKIFMGIIFIILFSIFFVNKYKNCFIDFVKTVAALCVFSLHTHIFTQVPVDKWFVKITYTPAWGGVWCFMILSSFLAEKSFMDNRYVFSLSGIGRYYKQKIMKIVMPTLSFIFLSCVLVFPTFITSLPELFWKFFTFRYIGAPGVDGIGATWYISTSLGFYLLVPLLSFLLNKMNDKKLYLILLFLILFSLGVIYRIYAIQTLFDWNKFVYCPLFANLDLFVGGMILAILSKDMHTNKILKKIALSLFLLLIFVNILIYVEQRIFLYQVVFPSLYLLFLGFGLMCFSDEKFTQKFNFPVEKLIRAFSSISFEFYLFHSLILHTLMPFFAEKNKYILHFEVLSMAFICTLLCSIGFHRIFFRRK